MKIYRIELYPYAKTGLPVMSGRAKASSEHSATFLVMKDMGVTAKQIKRIKVEVEK